MSTQRHERVYELFRQACELPEVERSAFLNEACGDDDELRTELERLLAQDQSDPGFLEAPALMQFSASGKQPGMIGKYRIIRTLGRGGMGVVYLAEQDSPHRTVGLKVLAPGAASTDMLARFAVEADALARLQHPGIAQIYEAGTADSGAGLQPFFAMEYVEGRSLLEHAEAKGLDDEARLDLLARICDAVHHAHQKGVIHRDLKPANIIVTNDGQPKVLDFGVARLTDADIRATTLRTNVGELIGTIPYMSPEQAAGQARELDTRSDVYALGVIGYELLSGRLPYDLQQRMIQEAVRVVQEQRPTPLSSISARLRGDVETIIGKALEKEPQRRYQSASAFSEDIRRFLNDEPIAARPASAVYQIRKFTQRHTGLVMGAAAFVLLLIAAVIVTAILASQLAQQRDEAVELQRQADAAREQEAAARAAAEHEARVANAISGFLADVFAVGSPYVGKRDMTVAEALDLAAQRVEEKLAHEPQAAAAVRLRLADTYYTLGNLDASLAQAKSSLMHAQKLVPPDPRAVANSHSAVGQLQQALGDLDAAQRELRTAMEMFEQNTEPDNVERLTAMTNYAALLYKMERYAEAEPIMREVYDRRQQAHGPEHPYTLTALNNLANVVRRQGRLDEAEPLIRRNMELHRKVIGDRNPNTITGIYNYADLLRELKRYDESEQLFKLSMELGRDNLPTNHWLTGLYRDGYGEMLRAAGRYDEAETNLLGGYHILSEQLGNDHPRAQRSVQRLIALYEEWGRADDADQWRQRLAK